MYENIHLSKHISIGLTTPTDAGEVKYPLTESEHTHLSFVTNTFQLLFQRKSVPCLLACPLYRQCMHWTIYSTHLLKSHSGWIGKKTRCNIPAVLSGTQLLRTNQDTRRKWEMALECFLNRVQKLLNGDKSPLKKAVLHVFSLSPWNYSILLILFNFFAHAAMTSRSRPLSNQVFAVRVQQGAPNSN